jgi:malate dehydrogenase (oxaloacetate-decarboxylating)
VETKSPEFVTTALSGYELLADPQLNKGTAFSETERETFDLHGLLPPNVATLDEQVSRRLQALRGFETDLERYCFLRELQDTNETLIYALLVGNLEELLPIVYTPTVGAGCQQFSRLFRKPRGLFLSIPHKDRIDRIFAQPRFDQVEAIVVT